MQTWSKRNLLALVLVVSWLGLSAVQCAAQRIEHVARDWKPAHYELFFTFGVGLNEISTATAEISIDILRPNVEVIELDFGALDIDAVTSDGRALNYAHKDERLFVTLARKPAPGSSLVLRIVYHGRPADGLTMTKDKDGGRTIVGDNWPNRVHHWIPCLDHPAAKATVTWHVTVPDDINVVANGKSLGAVSAGPGARVWSFEMDQPISPYNFVIAVGIPVIMLEGTQNVTALSFHVPASDAKVVAQGFAPAAPALQFFNQTIAPFPYPRLALIVGATRFGGMENAGAIVFQENIFGTIGKPVAMSRAYGIPQQIETVVAHEIAHQWFGDAVTESTWSDLWLSEGFATYFAGLFVEHYDGRAAFDEYMTTAARTYFTYEAKKRTPIHDEATENLFNLLNPNNYEKGAWVLHMLRGLVGDELFFKSLRAYYADHRNGVADTNDLRAAFEKTTSRDLREFFQRWIYQSGHPVYALDWNWQQRSSARHAGDGVIELVLRQEQKDEPFLMPIVIELQFADGKQRVTVMPTRAVTKLSIPGRLKPLAVVLDPDGFVLKEVRVQAATAK